MKITKMIKTMKSKSFILALLTISTLGLTTSCADMFDIDSTRVVYEKDHNLDSTADSVYTTLGVLQCMQQIADRYVILGEVRGDMCDINANTKGALRNLANFEFDKENEYLRARDYYAVINNCSYALAKMDTTLTQNNNRVMIDEFAALLSIRAWTYLQLAINYGEVPYYDYKEVVTTMEDFDKVGKQRLNVKQLAEVLIPQLEPYVDYLMPTFVSSIPQNAYPIIRLIIADLYLWSGDYQNAYAYYNDYLFNNKKFETKISKSGEVLTLNRVLKPASLMEWNGKTDKYSTVKLKSDADVYTSTSVATSGYENLAYIKMELDQTWGTTSELPSLFYSYDNTHHLVPSTSWRELSDEQVVFFADKDGLGNLKKLYKSTTIGDMRSAGEPYAYKGTDDKDNEFQAYTKLGSYSLQNINIYRRTMVYLRCAEALNSMAYQLDKLGTDDSLARDCAERAFYVLKDASKAFPIEADSADLVKFKTAIQSTFIGVHARGAGDVAYDTVHYVLKPAVIASRLGKSEAELTLCDTISYVDELLIDELALETTMEGNRFGDLIRFAERRGEPEFLAKRVASRKGKDNFDATLYDKLMDKTKWYLPLK